MRTITQDISPAIASEYLKRNDVNRKPSATQVVLLAEDMSSGNWKLTHQGILIGKGGIVVDGQHRLLAVVKSGVTVPMLVSFDETLTGPLDLPIDRAFSRSYSFILGESKAKIAVARLAHWFVENKRQATLYDTKRWLSVIDTVYGEVVPGTRSAGVSQAAILLAGCLRAKLFPSEAEYIKNTLTSFATDFTNLPPLPASFFRQVVVDRVRFSHQQLFSRSVRALDPARKNVMKLQVKDEQFVFDEALTLLKRIAP